MHLNTPSQLHDAEECIHLRPEEKLSLPLLESPIELTSRIAKKHQIFEYFCKSHAHFHQMLYAEFFSLQKTLQFSSTWQKDFNTQLHQGMEIAWRIRRPFYAPDLKIEREGAA